MYLLMQYSLWQCKTVTNPTNMNTYVIMHDVCIIYHHNHDNTPWHTLVVDFQINNNSPHYFVDLLIMLIYRHYKLFINHLLSNILPLNKFKCRYTRQPHQQQAPSNAVAMGVYYLVWKWYMIIIFVSSIIYSMIFNKLSMSKWKQICCHGYQILPITILATVVAKAFYTIHTAEEPMQCMLLCSTVPNYGLKLVNSSAMIIVIFTRLHMLHDCTNFTIKYMKCQFLLIDQQRQCQTAARHHWNQRMWSDKDSLIRPGLLMHGVSSGRY